ncbi:MAG: MerR family transcriptional regulator [Proteobacteria bacterium]|nr:MerR family transcriptional regulator [Pseudomonadota bacterium]
MSTRTGASAKAIRLYESLGLLSNINRHGSYRIYNEGDVEFVKLIKEAQTLGVSLSELKSLVIGHNELNWHSVIKLLDNKLIKVDAVIESMYSQKQRIEKYRLNIKKCLDSY